MDVTKLRSDNVTDKTGIREGQAASKSAKARKAADSPSAKPAPDFSPVSEEKVKWSGDALALKEGVEAAKSSPDVRADKVAALKAAIKNGTYKIDDKAVAEKMLRASLEEDIASRMD